MIGKTEALVSGYAFVISLIGAVIACLDLDLFREAWLNDER